MNKHEMKNAAYAELTGQGYLPTSKTHRMAVVDIVVDAVAGLIREDERELERARRIDRYDTTTIQEVLSDEREALRAKVESLLEYGCPEWEVDPGDDLGRHIRKDRVLALLDGTSDE